MNIKVISQLNKPIKYITKQMSDVAKHGRASKYPNVNPDVIEHFTPFRRLSKKPATLSDPEFFIKKFEKENPQEIPQIWSKMPEKNKVDFIVKNRYEKLLSNKIMNEIKSSKVEQSFILSVDGKIKYYGTLNSSTHCRMPSDLAKNSITIHNHPMQTTPNGLWKRSELWEVNKNNRPFSSTDFVNNIIREAKKAYVVDSKGGKYEFIPAKLSANKHNLEDYCSKLSDDFHEITINAYSSSNSIEEFLKKCYQNYINRINEDGHKFKILNLFNECFNHF